MSKYIEEVMQEFDRFMVDEYGKWKIGRTEAKNFIQSALQKQIEMIEWEVKRRSGALRREAEARDEYGGTGKETVNLVIDDILSILSQYK